MHLPAALIRATFALALGAAAVSANAGVVVHGSRVIYPAEQRGVSVRLENSGDVPSLVQTWIGTGNQEAAAGQESTVPFAIRPPIFRMDAGRAQVVRIVHTGEPMAADRESLYTFNVLDVPAKQTNVHDVSQKMHLVVRSQLKLLYRPKGLSSAGAGKAAQQIQWSLSKDAQGWALHARNPTPYYVSISAISVSEGHVKVDVAAPLETTPYRLTQAQYNALGDQVRFSYVTDLGKKIETTAPLARP